MTSSNDTSSMKHPIFRQLDEKHLAAETEVMRWSPKMDLIALANVQGEVTLHRLSWQKVWTLSPPADTVKVLSMAWRPDGKVLAIGYSSGVILLCDTENKDILHVNNVMGLAIFMQWTLEADSPEEELKFIFNDDSTTFLPRLPPLNKTFGAVIAGRVVGGGGVADPDNGEDLKKLVDQKRLNILIVGTDAHAVHLFAFGVFPCLEYSLKSVQLSGGVVTRICSTLVSNDFSHLFVVIEVRKQDSEKTLQMVTFELPLLASRRRELFALSMKYGQLASLLAYVSSTIQSVIESWEDILLEIDTKLMNYAQEKRNRASDETVADDFLELLMFGTPSDELEKFLLHDLTEKGLKKLVHSIELSYSNIQKLVLKHLQNVGQAFVYHLADVLGMARWYDRFGVLGLQEDKVDQCLSEAGAFMLKVTEVQQVIDQSMKHLKAFFRWLYVVIMRLSEEQVSGEITKITQQELHFVAHFLKENFSSNVVAGEHADAVARQPSVKGGFNLERVGQYLRSESLLFPPDLSKNPWVKFLEMRLTELKDDPLLYPHPTQRSLVQQHEILKESIQSAFDLVSKVTGRVLFPCQKMLLASLQSHEDMPVVRQACVSSTGMVYTAFLVHPPPSEQLILVAHSTVSREGDSVKAVRVEFNKLGEYDHEIKCSSHGILDFQFYNDDTVSLLLIEREMEPSNRPILMQLPLKRILDQAQAVSGLGGHLALVSEITAMVNGGQDLHSSKFQYLQGVKGLQLAVSGPRHVVCILFESKRRVRLFEMDVEEDEEEDEELSGIPDDSMESQPGNSSKANVSSVLTASVTIEEDEKDNSL